MYNDIIPRKQPAPQQPIKQALPEQPPEQPPTQTPHAVHVHHRATKKAKKSEGWRSVLTTVAILLLAPLFALLLTAYVFQTYQVDGPSMENTLHSNDRLIVWKVPRTWSRITGSSYIPERGDIVVFTEPRLSQFGQSPGKQLIKRVVALPGERVEISGDTLTVYNDEYPNGFQPDQDLPATILGDTLEALDTTVPSDHVFVAGDNRANSLDSRSFGPVHVDNIVGNLAVRILPLDSIRKF
jgi:signal peptidase I